jgi:hypothetical protein
MLVLAVMLGYVSSANAGDAQGVSVITGGSAPNDVRVQFNPGEYVYVSWITAPAGATIDVSVLDPEGNPVNVYKVSGDRAAPQAGDPSGLVWAEQGDDAKWLLCFQADTAGSYKVSLAGTFVSTEQIVGVGWLNVLPENNWGILMALAAGFIAFGVLGVFRTDRKTPIEINDKARNLTSHVCPYSTRTYSSRFVIVGTGNNRYINT